MSKVKKNKSKTYLLPLLSEVIELEPGFNAHIVDTYLFDDMDKYQNCFYILHDFSFRNPEFTAYEHKITNNQYFVDLIDIDNKVLYIFKFPDEFMKEYYLYKEGKYSEYGKDAKDIILNYFGAVYSGNLNAVSFLLRVKQILFKDEKLKRTLEKKLNVVLSPDAELGDILNIEEETFDLKKYTKENIETPTGDNINLSNDE